MLSFEDKIMSLCKKHFDKILLLVFMLFSVYLRYKYTPLVNITNGGSDYKSEILPWINYYKENGIKNTLASGVGDYYVPYNLIIGVISLFNVDPVYPLCIYSYFFEYLMAFYLYKIVLLLLNVEEGANDSRYVKYVKCFTAFSLCLPMVIANGAIWKQSDSVYSALICISLYYFLKKRYNLSFIWLGIAFSFKLQTILIIPFYLIAYFILREFSIIKFAWIPVIYAISGIPAILCGQRFTHVYGTYFRQVGEYGAMTINTPGIYVLGLSEYMYHHVAMVITIAILAFMMMWLSMEEKRLSKVSLLYLAGWCAMTCFEFLPQMHERYDYIAIMILTFVAVFFRHKIIPAVIGMHLTSACTYGKFLFAFEVDYTLVAIVYLIAYCMITYDFIKCCDKIRNNL